MCLLPSQDDIAPKTVENFVKVPCAGSLLLLCAVLCYDECVCVCPMQLVTAESGLSYKGLK